MKNICLLFLTGFCTLAQAQNRSTGLQAMNAAMLPGSATIDLFLPGKAHVYSRPVPLSDPSAHSFQLHHAVTEKKTIALSQTTLDRFHEVGSLTGRERNIGEEAKLMVFNESAYNAETGVFTFTTEKPKWKGAPYIYCKNCGTIVLQMKVEKNKKYLIQLFLAAEQENTYELFTLPDLQTPEIMTMPFGAQDLHFMIDPGQSGYITYYLRCIKPVSWSLSSIRISQSN